MLKLLIFDLDGTLADTGRDIADAINYALKPFGQKTYSVEETKAIVGSGISKLLESLIPPHPHLAKRGNKSGLEKEGRENAKEVVTGRFLEYYSEHLLDNTKAYPHVKETLSKLGDYKKAVVSNKREAYSKEILNGLGLLEYFDTVLGSDSVREKKPSPVPILDLLKKFNLSRDEAIIIGDSNYDVEAGKAAGIRVIGVTYGFRSIEFLKGSDIIIDSFDELLKVIPRPAD
ncbi:MAG TPA: HAD family hydrolase [Nitrospirae bacterium]|nr:HAD family hydrolase [Nitrospirota bacterium]HDL20958.1 HAD family hydrolase [Nitrospirota bacterium]HDZ01555.1 HAD family hydrolase [Nitrospirota bacterium]